MEFTVTGWKGGGGGGGGHLPDSVDWLDFLSFFC